MIRATFLKTGKGTRVGFNIQGHSGYAQTGKDIVCAAVSSCAYMTVNTITDVMHVKADVSVRDGEMNFRLSEEDYEICEKILKGFQMHIEDLARQYPDFIQVYDMEV